VSTDRRKRYTKKALQDSLVELLKTKPISKVTVTELCAAADINRSTYYTHYSDPYDQLSQLENEFLARFRQVMSLKSAPRSDLDATTEICQHYLENRDLFLILSNSLGGMTYSDKEILALKDVAFSQWQEQNYRYSGRIREYAYTYVISGTNGMIRKWLLEDVEQLSPREIAAIILEINNYGLRGK